MLSLTPLAVEKKQGSWRVGLLWGIGHGMGTLLVSSVLLVLASGVDLLGMALLGYRKVHAHGGSSSRNALGVGFIHGLTGAAALLITLPMVLSRSTEIQVALLAAFAVGSALAMAGLTAVISRVVGKSALGVMRHGGALLSVMLGSFWILH